MIQAGDSKRYLYYKVLSATGEKEALATIVEGLNKGNGAAKDAALDALLAWEGLPTNYLRFANQPLPIKYSTGR